MPFKSVVRDSKFRHTFGSNLKKDQCYDNIRTSKATWDTTFSAVNPKFYAVITEASGGGAFLVVPLSKTGRLAPDQPLVAGHKGPVLDISWCPHNDNVIASASDDMTIKIWQIPDEGVTSTLTEPVVTLSGHQRRVGFVVWHPSAQNILVSASSDNTAIVWNVGTGEPLNVITLPETVLSVCWNWNGSELLFSLKDKKLYRIDPRNGKVIEEGASHEGSKPCKAIYLKNGNIFTTGFTKQSERQYSVRAAGDIGTPLEIQDLDTSTGVQFPLYDPDVNLVYLCGKGDSVIRYFEITDEAPYVHYINTFQSSGPQRAIAAMPKRGVNFMSCEIDRLFRVNNDGHCQVIEFKVPRKSELFQDDLFPDTVSDVPAVTADDWWGGKNADPVLAPLSQGGMSSQKADLVVTQKSPNILNSGRPVGAQNVHRGGAAAPAMGDVELREITASILKQCKKQTTDITNKYERQVEELKEKVKNMETVISKQDNRIMILETQASDYGNKNED